MESFAQVGELFSVQGVPSHMFNNVAFQSMEEILLDWGIYPEDQIRLLVNDFTEAIEPVFQDMLDCLSDSMAELAPPNHYFGEAPHDTGVFGFWPVPDNFFEVVVKT